LEHGWLAIELGKLLVVDVVDRVAAGGKGDGEVLGDG